MHMASAPPNLVWHSRPATTGSLLVLYPGSFDLLASALGAQAIYHRLAQAFPAVDLAWIADGALRAMSGAIASRSQVLAVSIAWELELLDLIQALLAAGIAPLAKHRGPQDPYLVAGGALAQVNPRLLTGVFDLVVRGPAEDQVADLITRRHTGVVDIPWDGPLPQLPLSSAFTTSQAVLPDMFLIEAQRCCPHRCAFCSVGQWGRRSRFYPVEQLLAAIPAGPTRIGLVGPAVSDHPALEELAEGVVARGLGVSFSSLRADRITARLVAALAAGGQRSFTLAADGLSQRMRDQITKDISSADLVSAAQLAASHGLRAVKVYVMVGLPGETDADVAEFGELMHTMARLRPVLKLTVAASTFVPKPGTALAAEPFAGVKTARARLKQVRAALPRQVSLSVGSPRQAELETVLAHGGPEIAEQLVAAWTAGVPLRPSARLLRMVRGQ